MWQQITPTVSVTMMGRHQNGFVTPDIPELPNRGSKSSSPQTLAGTEVFVWSQMPLKTRHKAALEGGAPNPLMISGFSGAPVLQTTQGRVGGSGHGLGPPPLGPKTNQKDTPETAFPSFCQKRAIMPMGGPTSDGVHSHPQTQGTSGGRLPCLEAAELTRLPLETAQTTKLQQHTTANGPERRCGGTLKRCAISTKRVAAGVHTLHTGRHVHTVEGGHCCSAIPTLLPYSPLTESLRRATKR